MEEGFAGGWSITKCGEGTDEGAILALVDEPDVLRGGNGAGFNGQVLLVFEDGGGSLRHAVVAILLLWAEVGGSDWRRAGRHVCGDPNSQRNRLAWKRY